MPQTPLIAAIHYQRFFPINDLMKAVVLALRSKAIYAGGTVEEIEPAADTCRAPLQVVDIRTGRKEWITQDCGEESRGCRLDERGLAAITPHIMNAIEVRAPLIVLSKFGRAEAEGNGFMPCIVAAVEAELAVLTAVREPYLEAWRAFHGGLGVELPPDLDAVTEWCLVACRRPRSGETSA